MELTILGNRITLTIQKIEKPEPPTDQDQAYIQLNNLYLKIQKRGGWLTLGERLRLENLVAEAYDPNDFMQDWWFSEFQRFDGWLDV